MDEAPLTGLRLCDIGEYDLIQEYLVPRYGKDYSWFGSDCAVLPSDGRHIVATTDPCPPPLAHALGYEDEYYRGWLLGTINLSDIAAAGAKPLGLLTSLSLPADMLLERFLRLLDGVDDCASSVGTRIVGGNLRESDQVDVQGTALGLIDGDPWMRTGAEVGDAVCVVGDLGTFWAGALAVRSGLSEADGFDKTLLRPALTPKPKIHEALALRSRVRVKAAIDNSDGLGASLALLASASNVAIEVDWSLINWTDGVVVVSAALDVSCESLALGWGDWQLVVVLDPSEIALAEAVCSTVGSPFAKLANVRSGRGVHDSGGPVVHPKSERFRKDSWFTAGIDEYVSALTGKSIW